MPRTLAAAVDWRDATASPGSEVDWRDAVVGSSPPGPSASCGCGCGGCGACGGEQSRTPAYLPLPGGLRRPPPLRVPGLVPLVPGQRDEPWELGVRAPRPAPTSPPYQHTGPSFDPGIDPGFPQWPSPEEHPRFDCSVNEPIECDGCRELGGECVRVLQGLDIHGDAQYFYTCYRAGSSVTSLNEMIARRKCAEETRPVTFDPQCRWYETVAANCRDSCPLEVQRLLRPLTPDDYHVRCPANYDPTRYPADTQECRRRYRP